MGTVSSEQKLAYARKLYKEKGVTAPAKIQQAVKKKYGSGMNFRDLGKIFGNRKKKKAASAGGVGGRKRLGRPPGRPAKKKRGLGARGPGGRSGGDLLLMVGNDTEFFRSRSRLEARVGELISAGYSQDELKYFERRNVRVDVTTRVRL